MLLTAATIEHELKSVADYARADILQGFFKTGPGEYAEGDIFLGIYVPTQRRLIKTYRAMPLLEIQKMLNSPIHEMRFCGLQILALNYAKGDEKVKTEIFKLAVKNIRRMNNWDLVDITAPNIIGAHLYARDRSLLYKWAKSKNLWEKRGAMVSTIYFIRKGDYADTLKLADILLGDKNDLIHKVVGWMLREVGKKSFMTTKKYLDKNFKKMSRTTLRYAIEKFPEILRKNYLKGGEII
jgi:3-methyladenine DNA glycosylase AlkD